ncbi:Alpha/beta hydrolase [Candidatus Trichorickettsia mobilis]|uniref:Alpha/beta hydrolase n=1 Tax=Candidatus Trichorickettsia mobilis TaxID=1346319 RepID=A0ABZ0UV56_9RICK|nr:alpha/beta hydrolase [Candidatus Trichorickettsia mobilis]WPY00804.1 Alpha/beta hydrolase [Candidatus Trichorickettsia mobilis]
MRKIYNDTDDSQFIVYNQIKSNQKNTITIIFLHGLMSDMHGTKALYLENYCIKAGYNFIRFDNFGHGNSSGNFTEQTISSWMSGLEMILNKLVTGSIVLIGSSMGGWLSLLQAIKNTHNLLGIICISAAPDFTEELIWKKLPLVQQTKMQKDGVLEVSGSCCDTKYPISYKLVHEARSHLLLNKKTIAIDCPTHLIHGLKDLDVPYHISVKLMEKIAGDTIVLKLVKDADHRLARSIDLEIIANSINEIINLRA